MRVHFVRPYEEEIRTQVAGSLAAAGLAVGRIFGPDEPMTALLIWLASHPRDGLCIPYNPGTGGSGVDVVAAVLSRYPQFRVIMPVRETTAELVASELRDRLATIRGADPAHVLPMRVEDILAPTGARRVRTHFGLG